ncbi:MAG: hypothetical protein HONBIEJF_02186 [Fimbriimonadaceae bacterium]|nr:hypothetical protein [Fimbriimonadaceae bacterium]
MGDGILKRVSVSYFAVLREQRGLSVEHLDTRSLTVAELYGELQQRHGLKLSPTLVQFAVNGAFRSGETELRDGDEVVFIPPVAGG